MSSVTENINEGLAFYVHETLFSQWETDRQDLLENKWNRNLAAMKAEDWDDENKFKLSEGEETWKSKTYIPVTRQKVMSAYAIIVNMIMQGGRIPFMLTPSAWDNIVWNDLPPEVREQLEKNMQDMEKLIRQQLTESKADIALMQNIMSMAIYGETYAKRVVSTVIRNLFDVEIDEETGEVGKVEPIVKETAIPDWDFVSVWDIFRDWENPDLKDGIGIIHRQFLSPYKLRQLIGKPFYDEEAILEVINSVEDSEDISDSTSTTSLPPNLRDISTRKNTLEYLEFWGRASRENVEEYMAKRISSIEKGDKVQEKFDKLFNAETPNDGDEVEILCCLAQGKIVRFAVMRDASERPFFNAPWEINMDTVAVEGVADKLTQLQGVLNGAFRTYEDNKKLTGNMMFAVKEELLDTPLDEFKPGIKIQVSQDCDNVRDAIMNIEFPDIGESLLSLIGLLDRYIEENSMVPQISQGIQSKKDVTAFEVGQQLEGAGKYNGAVTRNLDTFLIKPMVENYYKYNMLNPDLEIPKGHYDIKALGFTTYQNKIVMIQKMQQFLAIIANNEGLQSEFDTGKIGEELTELMDINSEKFRLTDDQKKEQAERDEQAAERADELSRLELGVKQSEIQKDLAYAETQRITAQIKMEELQMEKQKANIEINAGENEAILKDLKKKGIPEEAVTIEDIPQQEGQVPNEGQQEPVNAGAEA